jgi:hypothetical protein
LDKFNIEIKEIESDVILPSIPDGENISIYSWNVNGFRSVMKRNEFDAFMKRGK